MFDDITLDDACTNEPEMSDEDKASFFASLDPLPEMSDEELDAMASAFEFYDADYDGYAEGHRDRFYW